MFRVEPIFESVFGSRVAAIFVFACVAILQGCGRNEVQVPTKTLSIEIDEDWLPAPDSLPAAAAKYDSLIADEKMAELAIASQAIGEAYFSKGDKANGLRFYAQAGRALRYAVELETAIKVHPLDRTAIFYYEARALVQANRMEDAKTALRDSFVQGFDNVEMLKTDPDLKLLTEDQSFDASLESWISDAVARKLVKDKPTFKLQFQTQGIDGNAVELEAYQGKIVIVDIWGTWCQPCVEELPSFINLQNTYASDLQILGFNFEQNGTVAQNKTRVQAFVEKAGINYPCIMGFDSIKRQIPNFGKYPTTVFLDRSGQVRLLLEGFHDFEYLEGIVKALIAE